MPLSNEGNIVNIFDSRKNKNKPKNKPKYPN